MLKLLNNELLRSPPQLLNELLHGFPGIFSPDPDADATIYVDALNYIPAPITAESGEHTSVHADSVIPSGNGKRPRVDTFQNRAFFEHIPDHRVDVKSEYLTVQEVDARRKIRPRPTAEQRRFERRSPKGAHV